MQKKKVLWPCVNSFAVCFSFCPKVAHNTRNIKSTEVGERRRKMRETQ